MYGTVKMRSKTGKDWNARGGAGLSQRPRSWGEFQSKLTPFHAVAAPGGNNLEIDGKEIPHSNGEPTKSPTTTIPASAFKPKSPSRPASVSSIPTPVYKPFRPVNHKQQQNQPHYNVIAKPVEYTRSHIPLATNLNPPPPKRNTKSLSSESDLEPSLDLPSLQFEEALTAAEPSDSNASKNAQGLDHYKGSVDADTPHRGQLLESVKKNAASAPEGTTPSLLSPKNSSNSRLSDSACECTSPVSASAGDFDQEITGNSRRSSGSSYRNSSSRCSDLASEASSVVDAGFFSNRERESTSLQRALDNEESEMPESYSPSAAPRKSRNNNNNVPQPLRSMYNRPPETNGVSVRSSSFKSYSSSSIDLTDDDVSELMTSHSASRLGGYEGDKSADDANSPTKGMPTKLTVLPRNSNPITVKRISVSSDRSSVSGSDAERPRSILRKTSESSSSVKSADPKGRRLGWTDDQSSEIGGGSAPALKDIHGTWPRRMQKSRRKQEQEEAEELMKRFRDTSDLYRSRFRSVFADTRRKMEEAVFGLRVSMAKNGYSARCYQLTFDPMAPRPDART